MIPGFQGYVSRASMKHITLEPAKRENVACAGRQASVQRINMNRKSGKMSRIVIVEDDANIRDELAFLLTNEGYQVVAPTDLTDAATRVAQSRPDLILLDLGLPGRDGFALCQDIRKISRVPIIFVTSRDNSMDELKALGLGGDDYVTKPYNVPVLLARVKVALRRNSEDAERQDYMEVNGLCLDLGKGVMGHGDKRCEVSKNEIRILRRLMRQPGEIVTRADLIEYLWDNQVYIDDNTLSVNVTRLRAKLDELGLHDYITTKRGMGYKI